MSYRAASVFLADQFVLCGGSILFGPSLSHPTICILHHQSANLWLLPKGRKDQGEGIETAAIRETMEETGFPCHILPINLPTRATVPGSDDWDKVRVHSGSTEPFAITMRAPSSSIKFIAWFITQVDEGAVQVQGTQMESENYGAEFMVAEEAINRLTFADDKEVAAAALALVKTTNTLKHPIKPQTSAVLVHGRRQYAQYPPGGGGGFPGMQMMGQGYQKGEALKEFSIDLTELARAGKLDPTIGRDEEIRRTIQILSRRTKSNPVLLGQAGTGKTAILEGLASRIVSKEVPESLHNKKVLSLDLASLVAGSGIRGQFESKFKALLRDIEGDSDGLICFIDELHMLLNLGKAEGSVDAGQMIKPALARGSLHMVGATTPDEYRKSIEKDPALARRFQPVQIEEPTVESTISILRGLKSRYELHHGVEISDAALVTAAVYGARYISDRFLPDKAIDLIDEAASALRLQQESKPDELEALEREIVTLQIELESLRKETDIYSVDRRNKVEETLAVKREQANNLNSIWQRERSRLQQIKDTKRKIEEAKYELEVAQRQGEYEKASRLRFSTIPGLEAELPNELERAKEEEALDSKLTMLHERVTSADIGRVVSKATGIPVQNLLRGERKKLVQMEDDLRKRVVGQDHVLAGVSDAVRIARAGLQNPKRPVASFLFMGATGTGKTELAKALAEFLYNDEQRGLININMSEYHDRYTVSRLIGAAPGLIGYDEGGQLTEAVRRKPYAVLLLDEIEKAHPEVSQILLQILDEGSLTDSQGRKVDFKNTIIVLTSNLGSDVLADPSSADSDGVVTALATERIMARASDFFAPELLNRLDSIQVFNKLSRESILAVVELRLKEILDRVKDRRITLDVDDAAKDWLAKEGYSERYGARAIARVVRTKVLFPLAKKMLTGTIRNGDTVTIRMSADGVDLEVYDNHAPEGGKDGVHDIVATEDSL